MFMIMFLDEIIYRNQMGTLSTIYEEDSNFLFSEVQTNDAISNLLNRGYSPAQISVFSVKERLFSFDTTVTNVLIRSEKDSK